MVSTKESYIAWLLRMKPRQDRNRHSPVDSSTQNKTPRLIVIEELEKAEVTILKIVQAESFSDDVSALKGVEYSGKVDNRNPIKQKMTRLRKSSPLYRLDLFLIPVVYFVLAEGYAGATR